jgi:hypothetical protein
MRSINLAKGRNHFFVRTGVEEPISAQSTYKITSTTPNSSYQCSSGVVCRFQGQMRVPYSFRFILMELQIERNLGYIVFNNLECEEVLIHF